MIPSTSASFSKMEYVQPLISTMDTSQSPLALLAMTCNSIGKDAPTSRLQPSLAALDEFRCRSPLSDARDQPSPVSSPERDVKVKARIITVSPRAVERKKIKESSSKPEVKTEVRKSSSPGAGPLASSSPERRPTSSAVSTSAAYAHGLLNPSLMASSPFMDPSSAMASLQAYQMAMATQSVSSPSAALGGVGSHMGMNPMIYSSLLYQQYMRNLAVGGGHPTGPGMVCRDPMCNMCQLQNKASSGPCPAGCTQCTHEKSSLLSRLAATQPDTGRTAEPSPAFPYPCNWLAGNDFCGKRFATVEELIAHVRSHTTPTEASLAASLPGAHHLGYPAGLGSPGLAQAAAAHKHLAEAAAAHKHLSEAAASLSMFRHHPYKPTLSPSSSSHLSSLPPYAHSPYNLLGARLGTTVVP